MQTTGITGEGEVLKLTERWGKNHLAVALPSFVELLQKQLLSPLAIFQVFCALLWLLDEYWTYTLFSLGSVIMYEATTVFQRTRTQQMLGGMAPKPTPIYAYRGRKWSIITSKDLLPGDIISLAFKKRGVRGVGVPGMQVATNSTNTDKDKEQKDKEQNDGSVTTRNDLIPCDCLLLRGSAIVNEASLTGESVPQMKEALSALEASSQEGDVPLDINHAHRVHTLFSGCSLVTVSGGSAKGAGGEGGSEVSAIPSPPDGGVVAYVLRTGFGSSQGSLLQMIEFSQQSVSGDNKETGLALLLLFVFALMASGYVLKEGLRKKEKTTHEVLLRCVIIITSVVPRQFPMQMAVAVNMALMTLSKAGIFCTEPYRVPLAGKISHCLFDKTGTITTDQLMPAGLINVSGSAGGVGQDEEGDTIEPTLSPIGSASAETALILAACHSLVALKDDDNRGNGGPSESTLIGDPIELAAMKALDWSWDGETSTASPDGAYKRHLKGIAIAQSQLSRLKALPEEQRAPTHAKDLAGVEHEISILQEKAEASKQKLQTSQYTAVHVVQRHHFSSALQRMSVVAKCAARPSKSDQTEKGGGSSSSAGQGLDWFCLVKGSPEALRQLILPSVLPKWYADVYEGLARAGFRVLALAYKRVHAKERPHEQPRQWVEADLLFGGFVAFECKVRSDSSVVIKSLLESDHHVTMLTGDALLTSLHVAKLVHICDPKKHNLALHAERGEDSAAKGYAGWSVFWKQLDKRDTEHTTLPFSITEIDALKLKYNLLTTEEAYLAAAEQTAGAGAAKTKDSAATNTTGMWRHVADFVVFSRMSPQGKAAVIKAIQDNSKDHHVFMCGDGGNDVGALKQADVGLALLGGHANSNTRAAHMKDFQARYHKEQQAWLQEEIQKRTAQGEYMAMFSLMKDQATKMKQAMAEENVRFMALHGQVWDPKTHGDGTDGANKSSIEALLESSESSGGLPMVRPGDASVAAPFTSRIPSIRAVVDLIRQGRCTLLSALMQQQIMMLESIISAYTLSSLSLHNARSSERQMMASSWLVLTAAISFSYASPVDHMHPLRPLRSLFNPAIILSIFGQALIHIGCMTLAVHWATSAMGPEKLQEVTEFFKKAKANEIDRSAHCGEEDMMCQFQAYWMAPFLPNLLNSVVFLVETSQMISVFFTNYKGRPWMKGMMENHPLFLSVFACIAGVTVVAWEFVPQLNELIQIAPFPDDSFRYKVLFLVISTIIGTFVWDRLCIWFFAPRIFRASMEEFSKTSWQDFLPILMTLAKVAAGLVLLGTGNILLIGMAIWWYRSYSNKQQEAQLIAAK
ncbi:hypothetical protein EON64_05810 [archaeon]|nr:MAG: hypothetical protein EON64_05810 [archaeon]